jgi:3-deoxy-D-manno-octulosonic-acid transferase
VSLTESVYRSAATAAWLLSPAAAVGESKVARAVRARRTAADRLAEWARTARDPARPLLWMHAPSVGEGLQARVVLEALAVRRPDLQLVFTYFSPSAEGLAARMPVDYAGPLPWDTWSEIGRAVVAASPSAVVFTKTEVWPTLAEAARVRGARTALVAASLHEGSSRLRWPARALLRETLASLDLCAAVGAEDAERFARAGARRDALRVSGDPGVDAAAARVRGADPAAQYLRPFLKERRPTLVAGSTWRSDERILLPTLDALRPAHHELRVVIAPHEPTPRDVLSLGVRFTETRWVALPLSKANELEIVNELDVVIVDRVGILAHLYTIGDIAWVGGGFHRAGVHSVLEPAAAGLPMVFGPRSDNARAARDLVALGAAKVIQHGVDARQAIATWLHDSDARRSAGDAGRRYIEGHLGAAERTAELVSQLIPATSAR